MVSRLRQGYWCIAAVQPAHGGRGRTHHRAAQQRLEDVHPHHGMFFSPTPVKCSASLVHECHHAPACIAFQCGRNVRSAAFAANKSACWSWLPCTWFVLCYS